MGGDGVAAGALAAGGEVEAAFVERADNRAPGDDSVRERSAAMRAGGIEREPRLLGAEEGDRPAVDHDDPALAGGHILDAADADHSSMSSGGPTIAGSRSRNCRG